MINKHLCFLILLSLIALQGCGDAPRSDAQTPAATPPVSTTGAENNDGGGGSLLDSLPRLAATAPSAAEACTSLLPWWFNGHGAAYTVVGPPPGPGGNDPSDMRSSKDAIGLFGPDGSVQAPLAAPNTAIWLLRGDTGTLHAPRKDALYRSLAQSRLPIPRARWDAGDGIEIQTELTALKPNDPPGSDQPDLFLYRVQAYNTSGAPVAARICLVFRPYSLLGPVAALPSIGQDGRKIVVGEAVTILLSRKTEGVITIPPLRDGDPACVAACFDVELAPADGEFATVTPACTLDFLICPTGAAAAKETWPTRAELTMRYAETHIAWDAKDLIGCVNPVVPDEQLRHVYDAAVGRLVVASASAGLGRNPAEVATRGILRTLESTAGAMALNRAGQFASARKVLSGLEQMVQPDGSLPDAWSAAGGATGSTGAAGGSTSNATEDTGRALFSLVDHYRFTDDAGWLQEQASLIERLAGYLAEQLSTGAQFRTTGPKPGPDYADIRYAASFWALCGLESAAVAMGALGKTEKQAAFTQNAQALRNRLPLSISRMMKAQSIVHLPAGPARGLSLSAGFDRADVLGNGAGVWPAMLFTRQNTWLRYAFVELYWDNWFKAYDGAFRHSGAFHPAGMELGPPLLVLNKPEYAFRLLDWHARHVTLAGLHTWATSWPESGAPLESSPSVRADAAYVTLLRSLLVLEWGDYLFLAPGVTDKWFEQKKEIGVYDAPTYYGEISFRIRHEDFKTRIDLLDTTATPPRGYKLNQLYPVDKPRSVIVDGQSYHVVPREKLLLFPPQARVIEIIW